MKLGKRATLGKPAKGAVLISGKGTNMAALLYASRVPEAPYAIVLVASNGEVHAAWHGGERDSGRFSGWYSDWKTRRGG